MSDIDKKQLLINALKGCRFSPNDFAEEMTRLELATFNGSSSHENWSWATYKLNEMEIKELEDLYIRALEQ